MLTEITGNKLREAVEEFRGKIRDKLSYKGDRTLAFPGGASEKGENYELRTPHGLFSIIIVTDKPDLNRYMHFVTLDQQKQLTASDTEINIPKQLDRRISTLLAEDGNHRYICNRGRITVNKSSLRRSLVLDHFEAEYGSVVRVREGKKIDSVIRVADLAADTLFEDIALFTWQIKKFKMQFRNI